MSFLILHFFREAFCVVRLKRTVVERALLHQACRRIPRVVEGRQGVQVLKIGRLDFAAVYLVMGTK